MSTVHSDVSSIRSSRSSSPRAALRRAFTGALASIMVFGYHAVAFAQPANQAPAAAVNDGLTAAEGIMKRVFGLALTTVGAVIFLVCAYVVITQLMEVARRRTTFGEVAGTVFGVGAVGLFIGVLVGFGATQTALISAQ